MAYQLFSSDDIDDATMMMLSAADIVLRRCHYADIEYILRHFSRFIFTITPLILMIDCRLRHCRYADVSYIY